MTSAAGGGGAPDERTADDRVPDDRAAYDERERGRIDRSWHRVDTLAVVCLLLAPWLRWWPLLAPGPWRRWFEDGDFVDQFYAFARFEVAQLSAGRWPLWNPYAYGGSPFWADIQAAVAYPPSLFVALGHALLGDGGLPYLSLELEAVAHVGLLGAFTYAFARRMLRDRMAATVAALVMGLGGWANGYPPLQLAVLETAAWLPLALIGIERVMERPTRWSGALLALALGMLVLAGHPQTTVHALTVIAAWSAWRLWRRPHPGGVARWRVLARLAVAAVLGAGLSAAAWIPALEFLTVSNRAQAGYDMLAHGFPPAELLGLVVPGLTKWSPLYVGTLPLMLALAAAADSLLGPPTISGRAAGTEGEAGPDSASAPSRARGIPQTPFWIGLAVVALLMSLGGNGVVFDVFYHLVPGFDLFRGQERAAWLVSFALAMLAADGVVRWRAREPGDGSRDAGRTISVAVAGGGSIRGAPIARRVAVGASGVAAAVALVWLIGMVFRAGASAEGAGVLPVSAVGRWMATATLGWTAWRVRHRRGDAALAWVAVTWIALDLVLAGFGTNLVAGRPAELQPTPIQSALGRPEATALSAMRVQDHPDRGPRRWPPNAGMIHGYQSLDGASPLRLRHYVRLRDGVPAERLRELTAVGHVVSAREDIEEADPVMISASGDRLHALRAPRPRAWRVGTAEMVLGEEEALERLNDDGFDPLSTVLLHEGTPGGPNATGGGHSSVRFLAPGEMEVETSGPAPGWLVFSEVAAPGWRATIDGRPAEVLRANVAQMAVAVPEGERVVHLEYGPRSVRAGLTVSLAFASLLAAMVGARALRRVRHSPTRP